MKFLNFNKYFLLIGLLISFNALQASAGGEEAAWKAAEDARAAEEKDLNDKILEDKKKKEDLKKQHDLNQQKIEDERIEAEKRISDELSQHKISADDADVEKTIAEKKAKDALNLDKEQFQKESSDLDQEITILSKKVEEISQQQVQDDIMKNYLAQKKIIQEAVETQITKVYGKSKIDSKGLDIDDVINKQDANILVKNCTDRIASFSKFDKETDFLSTDQKNKISRLIDQNNSIILLAHSEMLYNTGKAIELAVQKTNDSEKINIIKNAINNVYGTDINSPFYKEKIDLLKMLDNGSLLNLDYTKKALDLKNKLQEINSQVIKDFVNYKNIMEDELKNPLSGFSDNDIINNIKNAFEKNSNYLENQFNQYQKDLNNISPWQRKVLFPEIISGVENDIKNGDYDNKKITSKDVSKMDYDLRVLNETREALEKEIKNSDSVKYKDRILITQSHLNEIIDKIKQLSDIKLAVDTKMLSTHSGAQKLIDQYNVNAKGAADSVKSVVSRLFSKVADATLDTFNMVIKDKPITSLKDQVEQMQKGITAIQKDLDTYSNVTVKNMISKIDDYQIDDIPTFDFKKPSVFNDPEYQDLSLQVSDADNLLLTLKREKVCAINRYNAVQEIGLSVSAMKALATVSSELKKLPEFIKIDGSFDGDKMKNYFIVPKNATPEEFERFGQYIINDYETMGASFTKNQIQEMGKAVIDGIQGKNFIDMNYNEATMLVHFYKDKLLAQSESSKNKESDSVRDLTNLLDSGGALLWEQIKSLINGKEDYQQFAQKNDSSFADSLEQLNKIEQSVASAYSDLQVTVSKLGLEVDSLKEWIDKANTNLGRTPIVDNDEFIIINNEDYFIEEDTSLEEIGFGEQFRQKYFKPYPVGIEIK